MTTRRFVGTLVMLLVLSAPTVEARELTVVMQSPTSARASWDPNPADQHVIEYIVAYKRGQASSTNVETQVPVPASQTPSLLVTGLTPGEVYTFRVFARNSDGMSPPSASVSATITNPDTEAPSSPGSFTAIANSPTQVTLSWASATDNVAVIGYRVRRGLQLLTTTEPATETTFTDSGLTPSTAYSYSVTAEDAAGNTSAPATATVTTPAVPTQPKPCVDPAGKPYSITIVVQAWTKQLAPGARGRVDVTLANAFAVTQLQVLLGTQVVGEVPSSDLRDVGALTFSVPRTPGTYNLVVAARDALGCRTVTTAARPLVVQ